MRNEYTALKSVHCGWFLLERRENDRGRANGNKSKCIYLGIYLLNLIPYHEQGLYIVLTVLSIQLLTLPS